MNTDAKELVPCNQSVQTIPNDLILSDCGSEPLNKKLKLCESNENELLLEDKTNLPENNENKFALDQIEENKSKSLKAEKNDDEDDEEEMIEHEIPEEGFTYPLEMDSSDMLDEVDFDGDFPSVTDRYLTPYYQINVQKPGDDVCIRIHSNRICMISLAPSHIIFQENKTIESCNFKVSDKLDRTKNKVSGKAKHGAQPLQSNSNLCCLTCTDGSSYMIKCCMIGKLIEVNERLMQDPELLKKEPHFGGYIAIVLPNLKHLEKTKDKLLTQQLYEEAIKKRKEETQKTEEKSEINIEIVEKKKDKDVYHDIDVKIIERKNQNLQNNHQACTSKELNDSKDNTMEFLES